MSPPDIGQIQPVTPSRNVARDREAATVKSSANPTNESKSDSAVKVETGSSVDPGLPPLDRSRVELIRKALQQGTYPINPVEIADAMIAAPLMLSVGR